MLGFRCDIAGAGHSCSKRRFNSLESNEIFDLRRDASGHHATFFVLRAAKFNQKLQLGKHICASAQQSRTQGMVCGHILGKISVRPQMVNNRSEKAPQKRRHRSAFADMTREQFRDASRHKLHFLRISGKMRGQNGKIGVVDR